jgi:hypothetical protein
VGSARAWHVLSYIYSVYSLAGFPPFSSLEIKLLVLLFRDLLFYSIDFPHHYLSGLVSISAVVTGVEVDSAERR